MGIGQLVLLEAACTTGLLLSLVLAMSPFDTRPVGALVFWSAGSMNETIPGTVLSESELRSRLRETGRFGGLDVSDSLELLRISAIHGYDLRPEDREMRDRLLEARRRELQAMADLRYLMAPTTPEVTAAEQDRRKEILAAIGPLDMLTPEERSVRALSAAGGDSMGWVVALLGLIGVGATATFGLASLWTWLAARSRHA